MTTAPAVPREWAPIILRRGWAVSTATQVALWRTGILQIPSAAYDALGVFERVHLYTSGDRPGFLWLVPAEDDDTTAYRLCRISSGHTRALTAVDLPERLGVDPNLDVVRGDWKIVDFDQIVVQFPVREDGAS